MPKWWAGRGGRHPRDTSLAAGSGVHCPPQVSLRDKGSRDTFLGPGGGAGPSVDLISDRGQVSL